MTTRRLIPLAFLAVLLAFVPAACGRGKSAEPAATYTVRGVIKALPGSDGTISIHHEAIPTFTNQQGKATGMMSMTMPFGVAPGVSLENLAAGDKIEFTLAIDWQRNPVGQVTAVKKLAADTTLELSGH